MFKKMILFIRNRVFHFKEMKPRKAYDLWSTDYDDQAHNLVLALDEKLFNRFIDSIALTGKVILDIGCGTGRHWKKLLAKTPGRLVGYDVSKGMLRMLQLKFPGAETHLLKNHRLYATPDMSCDLIVSTLTIAHIPNLELALNEWNRILKPGGDIIITDFHPSTLATGGKRMFFWKKIPIEIESNVYTIDQIKQTTKHRQWSICRLEEIRIDDSVREHFEKQHALDSFDRNKGMLMIYGIHLKKANAAI